MVPRKSLFTSPVELSSWCDSREAPFLKASPPESAQKLHDRAPFGREDASAPLVARAKLWGQCCSVLLSHPLTWDITFSYEKKNVYFYVSMANLRGQLWLNCPFSLIKGCARNVWRSVLNFGRIIENKSELWAPWFRHNREDSTQLSVQSSAPICLVCSHLGLDSPTLSLSSLSTTTAEGKGHLLHHPCGLGLVMFLPNCRGKFVTAANWSKIEFANRNVLSVSYNDTW